MAANPAEHFTQLASTYENLVGLITGDIAHYILDDLIPAPDSNAVIHDNACGTGLVTQYLEEIASRRGSYPTIHATDFVPSVVDITKHKSEMLKWKNVHASVMDSQALTFSDGLFDLSITNFGIFFLPEPQKGADHIYRTLKPGGTAIVTIWKERPFMETVKQAQKLIRPDLEPLSAPWEKEWSEEETLRTALERAGFKGENIQIVERRTDAAVEPFLHDVQMLVRAYPAAVKEWREEEKERLGPEMLKLVQDRDDGPAGGLCFTAYIAIAKK